MADSFTVTCEMLKFKFENVARLFFDTRNWDARDRKACKVFILR